MFNRSIKYIILLCLNIIVLLVLYVQYTPQEDGVFDTQFVIGLLEERDELQSSLIDAELNETAANRAYAQLQKNLTLLTSEKQDLRQSFQRCETTRLAAENITKEQAAELAVVNSGLAPPNCDAQLAKVRLARQELAATQVLLDQQKTIAQALESKVASATDNQPSPEQSQKIEALERENAQLKADIENPIYLKSVYMSGRKCEKPKFDALVCIQELLVRPQFSKAPVSDVIVTVYAPNNEILGSASFTSKRAQLYRFSLGRGRELIAGEFKATFEVEGQLLRSDGHKITQ